MIDWLAPSGIVELSHRMVLESAQLVVDNTRSSVSLFPSYPPPPATSPKLTSPLPTTDREIHDGIENDALIETDALSSFFFAATHASIYRLVPTGLLGLGLGAVVLRAGSLWPAVLLHAAYNGLVVLEEAERLPWTEAAWWPYAPWAALPGLALLALPGRPRS